MQDGKPSSNGGTEGIAFDLVLGSASLGFGLVSLAAVCVVGFLTVTRTPTPASR